MTEPAGNIYGILRPGDVLRSGRVRIEHVGGKLEIWDGLRLAARIQVGAESFVASALPDPPRGIYPELERGCAVAAPQSLRPPSLPLVRQGQGSFACDLREEDLR